MSAGRVRVRMTSLFHLSDCLISEFQIEGGRGFGGGYQDSQQLMSYVLQNCTAKN
jgi:hypothetical protein